MGSENHRRPRALSLVHQEDSDDGIHEPLTVDFKSSRGRPDLDVTAVRTRARRAASPPPPYLPDLPQDLASEDSEAITCSLYSYTYSQNTAQLIHSRLHAILRALQRIQSLDPSNNAPMVPVMGKMANFPIPKDHGPDNIQAYIRVIQSALNMDVSSPNQNMPPDPQGPAPSSQRMTVPMVNFFRRESSTWLKSVSRILAGPVESETDISASDDAVKLLELLSTPIVDLQKPLPEKPRLFRRSSSYFSMPMIEKTFEEAADVPSAAASTTDSPPAESPEPLKLPRPPKMPNAAYDPTPLCQIPSKYASRTAVFTTTPNAPFKVLSLNDIACLMFGMAQHEAMDRSMVEYFSEGCRARVLDEVDKKPPSICMCGRLMDIVKNDVISGLASVWVEKSEKCIVWVIEEVEHDYVEIQDDQFEGPDALSHLTKDSFPGLFSKSPYDFHYYWTTVEDRKVPLLVSYDENTFRVQVRAPLTIAGAVVLDKDSNVVCYNLSAIHNMLGMGLELVGQSVEALFPRFGQYRKEIERICNVSLVSPGVIITEHLFRLVSAKSAENFFDLYPTKGITAMNRDGQELSVDLQVRTISADTQVLWVSYSRPPLGEDQCIIPSQMNLLALSRRMSATPGITTDASSPSAGSSEATTPLLTTKEPAAPVTPTTMLPPSAAAARTLHTPESGESGDNLLLSPSRPTLSRPVGSLRRVRKFADFKVIRTLGEGAYGEVLLVVNTKEPDQGEVALKCIAKDRILVDTWTRDRRLGTIPNEIKIMNLLRDHWHPNIIELIDFFEDDKYYHVEMVCHGNPGSDLFDLIEAKPNMTEKECQSIFFQVASAISHLHRQGIVHRDIKDENIIVDQNGFVKVIDFGSAAFTKQGPFDVFVGTVDYAAPEVLEGLPYEGYQQDVWALGILLYTIVYKENPFYNLDEIMEAAVSIPHDLSVDCTSLINLILVRDYRARPSSSAIMEHAWLADEVEAHKNIEGYS